MSLSGDIGQFLLKDLVLLVASVRLLLKSVQPVVSAAVDRVAMAPDAH